MTLRSLTTSTESKTFLFSASWSSEKKWAVQAMEFVLPEPAGVLNQVLLPRPFAPHGVLQQASDHKLGGSGGRGSG